MARLAITANSDDPKKRKATTTGENFVRLDCRQGNKTAYSVTFYGDNIQVNNLYTGESIHM